ncbi:MAG: hypothetical protein V4574_04875 [Pseudomonadota bacterium]
MHDPRRHRALAKIATIRTAERDAARHELYLAGEREREAHDASRAADERTLAAAAAWQDQLATGGFHPELASALGGELIARVDAAGAAQAEARETTGAREARESGWQLGTARCRQADDAFAASRRAFARDREERALEALADRISFDWTRR